MKKVLLLLPVFAALTAMAQTKELQDIRQYTQENAGSILHQFNDFLLLPNVAADSAGLAKNAGFILSLMKENGIQRTQFLQASTPGVPQAVYGEVMTPGATQTVIFYAHYDGQPVNAAQWAEGLEPFKPMLFTDAIDKDGKNIPLPAGNTFSGNWRLYARGASDDKAGVFDILQAYAAIKKTGHVPAANIKFFFEGEEEKGSLHLDEILEKNRQLLHSDLFIICDGPVHQSGKKQIVFGARGDAHLDLTVYASKRPLHSGHYGNWAPNPALMLAKLLASMKDDNGHVLVKGFYDDVTPLTAPEKKAIAGIPSVEEQMKDELGIISTETTGMSLNEAINLPALNIVGMQSGNVGRLASNQIPAFATAVLDLRLVPGNDWQKQQRKVIDHIKAQGYFVTGSEPTDEERKKYPKIIRVIAGADGYNAQRTSIDLPEAKKVINAVQNTTSLPVVIMPTMGGSLPLFLFEKYLAAKTITVPVANHDNNQHAANENIRLENLFEGIVTMASLMLMK